MDDQTRSKIKEMVKPLHEWIDQIAEVNTQAAKNLTLMLSCEVGIKLKELEKRDKLKETNNLN